jgi:voltage-gated potassium channel
VTVSTVGYGDIAPVTPEGRLVASVLITIGVALFATAVALVGRHLGEDRADAGLRTRLARIAELERLHAAGELETAAFSRRVRELSNAGDGD